MTTKLYALRTIPPPGEKGEWVINERGDLCTTREPHNATVKKVNAELWVANCDCEWVEVWVIPVDLYRQMERELTTSTEQRIVMTPAELEAKEREAFEAGQRMNKYRGYGQREKRHYYKNFEDYQDRKEESE